MFLQERADACACLRFQFLTQEYRHTDIHKTRPVQLALRRPPARPHPLGTASGRRNAPSGPCAVRAARRANRLRSSLRRDHCPAHTAGTYREAAPPCAPRPAVKAHPAALAQHEPRANRGSDHRREGQSSSQRWSWRPPRLRGPSPRRASRRWCCPCATARPSTATCATSPTGSRRRA
eukprot:COSAG04_NODE_1425_length_6816_cov_4.403752_6_plen_178_part_00